jgi:hypothetical protein
MLVHPRELEIRILGRDVVEQHAHPHTTVGGAKYPLGEYDPGGIRLPDVVLDIYGLLGLIRKTGADTETPLPRWYQNHSGLSGVGGHL